MTELAIIEPSVVNAVTIRKSTLGQYLESINTQGTWIQQVQETLGFQPTPFTALDAVYTVTGIAGMALLIPLAVSSGPVSIPLIAAGSTLIGLSAVGLSEEDRRQKIGAGIVGGTLVLFKPSAAGFVLKEAYSATKETVKQTVELAKSGIGLTTSTIGFGTAVIGTSVILKRKSNNKKRKRS